MSAQAKRLATGEYQTKSYFINVSLFATLFSFASLNAANSMEFEVRGNIIFASGQLNNGDTQRFFDGIGSALRSDGADIDYVISFNSDGGSLLEGVTLGEELRERRIVSYIENGNRCLSACAFAFLGGTLQHAVSIGPARQIEWGAHLGFHGFSTSNDITASINEGFATSRAINAILIEYTQRMGGVDFAWIAEALTSGPNSMEYVDTPRDLSSLSITILDGPNTPPDDWDANLCLLLLREILPNEDDGEIAYRLMGSSTLHSVSDIIDLIVNPVFSAQNVTPDMMSGEQALNIILRTALDGYRPIVDARQRLLDRGGGLYFDYCVAFRSSDEALGVLVDTTSGSILQAGISRGYNERENTSVDLFSWDEPLWPQR